VLPFALREENFHLIRTRLDRLEWHCASFDEYLQSIPANSFHAFNLSDIFEYLSLKEYHRYLKLCVYAGVSGARLAYWNMLVPRSRPLQMASRLEPQVELANALHARDKAFFYSDFVVEEIRENVS
jgi:S-adenosylmethionine-diacylglycerol 3-amino-3-carboxypropyl transferase